MYDVCGVNCLVTVGAGIVDTGCGYGGLQQGGEGLLCSVYE
jgi:hypothetical protein